MPLIRNARILTLNPHQPEAESLRYDHVIEEVGGLSPRPGEEVIDLDGAYVLPGLWDSHIHLLLYAQSLRQLDLGGCQSRRELLDRIQNHKATGTWMEGYGWAESEWCDSCRPPSLPELDEVCPHLPLFLTRSDLHSAVVNSAALRLAGITSATPDPPGGRFERDGAGRCSGGVIDMAMQSIRCVIPPPTPSQLDEALGLAIAQLQRWGIVGVCDQRLKDHDEGPQAWEIYRRLGPALRIHCNLAAHQIGSQRATLPFATGDDWLRVGHVKFFSDGSLGSRTARLKQPYEGGAGQGLWLTEPSELREGFHCARQAGYPISVHAIGDEAIATVLDLFAEVGRHPLDRVEHLQILHPDDLPRVAQWGGVASMQPVHLLDDRRLADELLGERASAYYRLDSLQQMGVRLSFGSDAPVATADPWLGLKAACQRKRHDEETPWYPQECLERQHALHAYTLGAASSLGWTRTGSLRSGWWADWIAVDRNPLLCPDPSMVKVVRTVVGGKTVFEAP